MEENILELSYIYFKHLLNGGTKDVGGMGTYITDSIRYHLLGFLIDYSGYNGFPTVVADKEFKKLDGTSWYHGFGRSEHGRSFLDSFSYHYGAGKHLDGFYLTDIITEAYKYVQDKLMEANEKFYYSDISLKEQKELTAEFKMLDANGIREEKLEEIIKKFNKFEESSVDDDGIRQKLAQIRKFIEMHSGEVGLNLFIDYLMGLNKSALAVYLGYDFVRDEVGYTVMLNRSKLAVKQSDFDKFSNLGKGEVIPEESGMQ